MDNKRLGELIRQKRKEKQMTQAQLAERLYVSTNAISKWELGRNSIDPRNLEVISEVLDIPLSLLQGNEEAMSQNDVPSPQPDVVDSSPQDTKTVSESSQGEKVFPDDSQENQMGRRKRKLIFLGAGVILLAVVAAVFFVWEGNQYSFTIQAEYFDTFDEEEACYLIAEYKGKFTIEILNEYADALREEYADYFNEVGVIVVLFCQDYAKDQTLSFDTADAVSVLLPATF